MLLKNDGALLPLAADQKVAVIGAFATEPRFQGAGSSLINPTRVDNALDELRVVGGENVSYAAGFAVEGGAVAAAGRTAEELRAEAVGVARTADVAVLFLGLPAAEESEGFDRDHIDLPAEQLAVLDAVLEVNPASWSSCPTAGSWHCPSPTACPRSSRAGCWARPVAVPSPMCSTVR